MIWKVYAFLMFLLKYKKNFMGQVFFLIMYFNKNLMRNLNQFAKKNYRKRIPKYKEKISTILKVYH